MRAQLEALARRHALSAVYVFGSRAVEILRRVRGETVISDHPEADVDIGVLPLGGGGGRRLPAETRVRLTTELEDLFDVTRVDLILLPEADAFLALDVIRGELLYCADPDEEAEYELYVLRRAGDLAPFAQERWEAILRGTAS